MTESSQIPWPPPDRFVIGYGQGCDYSVDAALSDELLAEISKTEEGWGVRDLGGSIPVLLNGSSISGRVPLLPGSCLRLGNWAWTVPHPPSPAGVTITLQDVSFHASASSFLGGFLPGAAKSMLLLQGINLQIRPGEFVGLLGPSGAGKSTLLHILNGDYSASGGQTWFDDQSAELYLRQHKHRLAYLPQEPIFHDSLTPRQALEYTARLRGLPMVVAGGTRTSATMLEAVGISHRADTPLRKLSGGERKRAALAMELLGNPSAVFLDEATSGLDPAREKEMMLLFRRLADDGKTVVCITHFPENLTLCDRLIVVAKGRVAFQGTPEELLARFRISRIEEIYSLLAGDTPPVDASVHRPLPPPLSLGCSAPERTIPGTGIQFSILGQRYLRTFLGDVKSLLLLLLQAPVIAVLVGMTFGVVAVSYSEQHAADWKQVAFLLVMSVIWCAATNGVREIVKERTVFRHESRYGLDARAYVLSKFAPLGLIGVVQAALLLIILGSITKLAGIWPSHFIVLALLALAATSLGLCISAAVKTSERAMTFLPMVLIAQAVFSGGLARLTGISKLLAEVGASAYWALDGLKSTLPSALLEATYVSAPGEFQPPILGRGWPAWFDALALLVQTGALLWIGIGFLRRSGGGKVR